MNDVEMGKAEEEMGMQGLEIIYQLFTNPVRCMQRLSSTEASFYVTLVIIFSGVSIAISDFILIGANSHSIIKSFLPFWLALSVIGIAVIWFISGAIFHLVAEWLHGQGKASVLLTALGLSLSPSMLTVPMALISQACGDLSFFVYLGFKLIILIWVIELQFISIREVHRISTFKTLLVFGSPSIIITGILIVLMIVLGVTV
ncbi:MAG: Yip1 family protein [Candidatus Desantisbacteria bacterium]